MKNGYLRQSFASFMLVAAFASAQPSHAPVCQSDCWVRDDTISPGKTECEQGLVAQWCENWVKGNGTCGDMWQNDPWVTCQTSNDVLSGPCSESTISYGGTTYIRITSADDGTGTCCFYAAGSATSIGAEYLVQRPISTHACTDGGSAVE